MKKFIVVAVLVVATSVTLSQSALAGGFRFSTGFYMEFGHSRNAQPSYHSPYYYYWPAPVIVTSQPAHAPQNGSNAGQQPNWTPPTPTPANGVGWSYPYQPYGNVYQPAYWYGW